MLEYNGIQIQWLGHDGFKITVKAESRQHVEDSSRSSGDNGIGPGRNTNDISIYIDPYQISKDKFKNDAQILLITHNHFDHLSIEDIQHITNENTIIIAADECIEKLKGVQSREIIPVKQGNTKLVNEVPIEAVPAYNTNKQYHPKNDGKVGYIITLNNTRIYHAGDTDAIEEMSTFKPDIALVPVSGTYVMTADEAAVAVDQMLRPKKIAVPMHYGSIVGSQKDAEKFSKLVKTCQVQILNKQ